jgi:hypothetical protein
MFLGYFCPAFENIHLHRTSMLLLLGDFAYGKNYILFPGFVS